MNSIEQLKGLASKGRGFARPNLYRVILPSVIGGFKLPIVGELLNRGISSAKKTVQPEDINLLCTSTQMPGRTLNTHERRIGMINKKVAYGFTVDEVAMRFRVLNDYNIKEYFEIWQDRAVRRDYQLAYFNDYTENVVIQAITNSPSADYDKLLKLSYAGLDQGGLTTVLAGGEAIVYTCLLENAYPVAIQAIEYGDAQGDALVEITVNFAYKDWKRRFSNRQDLRQQIKGALNASAINTVLQLFQ